VVSPWPHVNRHGNAARHQNRCDHRWRVLLASCRLHLPIHLSLPHLSLRNLQQQPHNLLHTHLLLVSNPNCHLKHPAQTKAGRNPKPVCLPPKHAKIGPWWTFSLCLMIMSRWCVSLTVSGAHTLKGLCGVKIPDEVTEYYLQRVGFDCQDARL
jgi:Transcription initiation factor TFIID 23-30kDa subunit